MNSYSDFKIKDLDESSFLSPDAVCMHPEDAGSTILHSIANAKKNIDLVIYEIDNNPRILEAFTTALKNGVKVRIMVNSSKATDDSPENPKTKPFYDLFRLLEPFGDINFYWSSKNYVITHQKTLLVDHLNEEGNFEFTENETICLILTGNLSSYNGTVNFYDAKDFVIVLNSCRNQLYINEIYDVFNKDLNQQYVDNLGIKSLPLVWSNGMVEKESRNYPKAYPILSVYTDNMVEGLTNIPGAINVIKNLTSELHGKVNSELISINEISESNNENSFNISSVETEFNTSGNNRMRKDHLVKLVPNGNAWYVLRSLINEANEYLILGQAECNSIELASLIVKAIKERNVKVSLIFEVDWGTTEIFEEMAAAGAEIYRVTPGNIYKFFHHAKFIVCDGEIAYLGSINLADNSALGNRELGILTKDKSVIDLLKFSFETDINRPASVRFNFTPVETHLPTGKLKI